MFILSENVCEGKRSKGGDRRCIRKRRGYRILPLVSDVKKTSTPRFHSIMVCHLQDACHKTIPYSLVACNENLHALV